jgi:glycosyltransferase involved in cell wall biosynthesis
LSNENLRRILHVGNIANNAYCAAYEDRKNGYESFVVSPHLVDLIATPEWEWSGSKFLEDPPLRLIFQESNAWFARGTWKEILKRWDGRKFTDNFSDQTLGHRSSFTQVKEKIKAITPRFLRGFIANALLYRARTFFMPNLKHFFSQFDLVVFYGPYAALHSYISEGRQFISLEHGTLDNFCRGNFSYCKDALHGYKNAKFVFVTNQSGLKAADDFKISRERLILTPHPSIDHFLPKLRENRLNTITSGLPTYLLAPSRHAHMSKIDPGKGNLIIFRALKQIIDLGMKIELVCIEIGDDLMHSKSSVKKLGLQEFVNWIPIQTRLRLKELSSNSIAVIDQINSPSYGTITTDSISIGVPVITAHNCDLDRDFFGTCAPVLGSKNEDDIAQNVINLMENLSLQKKIYDESIKWSNQNLDSNVVFSIREQVYKTI